MTSPLSGMERLQPEQDLAAQERLYLLHAPVVLAYSLHISSEDEAEDVLLEVFLAAIQSKEVLARVESSQRGWLLTVARYKVVDYYRRKGRRQEMALEDVLDHLYEDEAFSPEQVALQREAYEQVHLRKTPAEGLINLPQGACPPLVSRDLAAAALARLK